MPTPTGDRGFFFLTNSEGLLCFFGFISSLNDSLIGGHSRHPLQVEMHCPCPDTPSQLAEVVFRGCWDGLLGAFLVVPAGPPHPSGWLAH
jgi:hypothetical protein